MLIENYRELYIGPVCKDGNHEWGEPYVDFMGRKTVTCESCLFDIAPGDEDEY